MKRTPIALLIVAICALSACTTPLITDTSAPNMPNPASKHCVDQGHELKIRSEEGGQIGYCVFDDGFECEEWAYFRGQCAPGDSG